MLSCGNPHESVKNDLRNDQLIDSIEHYNRLFYEVRDNDPMHAADLVAKQMELSQKAGYVQGIADAKANSASLAFINGNYTDAIRFYMEASMKYDSLSNDTGSAKCHYNMAAIYMSMNNASQAQTEIDKAHDIHEKLGLNHKLMRDLQLSGTIYSALSHYKQAQTSDEDWLKLARTEGDSLEVAKSMAAIGNVLTANGESDLGLTQHLMALHTLSSGGIDTNSSKARVLRSELLLSAAGEYFLNNDYGTAIRFAQSALNIAKKTNDPVQQCNAYQKLGELYGLTGREDIQLQYNEQYNRLHDSITADEQIRALNEIELRYETLKKDNELSLQQVELDKAEIEVKLEQTKTNLYIAEGVAVLLLVTVAGLIIYYNKR